MNFPVLRQAIQQHQRLVTMHAAKEALAETLNSSEIWLSILAPNALIIEDYPLDPRGSSCLILSFINGRPVHTVIAYPAKRHAAQDGSLAIAMLVTVYRPDAQPTEWSSDYQTRMPQP